MRFPILFTGGFHLMKALGLAIGGARVEVGPDEVGVHMGWAFQMRTPRSSVVSARRWKGLILGWGVHGWLGRWLVNGSSRNLVWIDIEPRGRAWVGPFPVRVRTVVVSVEDPDGLVEALALAGTRG